MKEKDANNTTNEKLTFVASVTEVNTVIKEKVKSRWGQWKKEINVTFEPLNEDPVTIDLYPQIQQKARHYNLQSLDSSDVQHIGGYVLETMEIEVEKHRNTWRATSKATDYLLLLIRPAFIKRLTITEQNMFQGEEIQAVRPPSQARRKRAHDIAEH